MGHIHHHFYLASASFVINTDLLNPCTAFQNFYSNFILKSSIIIVNHALLETLEKIIIVICYYIAYA